MHVVGQRHVARSAGPPGEGAVRADRDTARYPYAARQRAVRSDAHVVRDLHQVVDLDAVFDHGVVERTAVDAGVGADFDVVANAHVAELLDLDPGALVRCEAEAVGADHHATVHDAARADAAARAEGHLRREARTGTDLRAGADHAVRPDDGPRTDHRAGLDDRQRADRRARIDLCARIHDSAGVNARHWQGACMPGPPLGQVREIQVGVGRHQHRAAHRGRVAQRGRDDHAGSLRRVELRPVAFVGEEAQRRRSGAFERADPGDAQTGVTDQFAAEPRGDLTQSKVNHIDAGAASAGAGPLPRRLSAKGHEEAPAWPIGQRAQ